MAEDCYLVRDDQGRGATRVELVMHLPDDDTRQHLLAIVDAARRLHEAMPAEQRADLQRRQQQARERIRARLDHTDTDQEDRRA